MNQEVSYIINQLRINGETLAVAESLTGGGLGALITAVPGASDVFIGGVTAYSSLAKESQLKVSHALLSEHGAVSEEVAVAMADGSREIFGSTWGISTTGVAGPGESQGVRPGTVWIAISGPINQSTLLELQGERESVRNATIASAITTFARILGNLTPSPTE